MHLGALLRNCARHLNTSLISKTLKNRSASVSQIRTVTTRISKAINTLKWSSCVDWSQGSSWAIAVLHCLAGEAKHLTCSSTCAGITAAQAPQPFLSSQTAVRSWAGLQCRAGLLTSADLMFTEEKISKTHFRYWLGVAWGNTHWHHILGKVAKDLEVSLCIHRTKYNMIQKQCWMVTDKGPF